MKTGATELETDDLNIDNPHYHDRKKSLDRVIAVLLLAPAAPLIAVLALIVRLTSPGPGIYKQRRAGRHGSSFNVYKIRTMYQNAEAVSGPQWAVPGDSRITPVGRVLRFLHLDELPQLFNVLRGEMSLVGPRPERSEFIDDLVASIPGYRQRLAVRPGITGLAQINLPPDETYSCVYKKTVVDLEYITTACAILDLRILICTALRMFGVRHGRAARWLRVEYPQDQLTLLAEEFDGGWRSFVNGDSHSFRTHWTKQPTESDGLRAPVLRGALAYASAGVPGENSTPSSPSLTTPRRPR